MASFFSLSRKEGFPTLYEENQTAATTDVLEAGFILAFVILAVSFFLVMPALRGKSQLSALVRVTVSLFIGVILMTSNFGQDWETAHIKTLTPYKAGQPHEINASIGMRIGLRSVNISLVEIVDQHKNDKTNPLKGEIIKYNEMFVWTWDQGRLGFGPYAGHLQQDFRKAQLQGLPLPILWVADYFTIDGEGLRFGRFYRTAGWYTHIVMWAAFPCWLLANFLFVSVIRYGAMFTMLTGLLQVLACILWSVIRNPNPLIIPFEDATLATKYGINFWLTLSTGIFCILIGIITLFMDLRYPDSIAVFFGVDPLSDYEEYHLTASELEDVRGKGNYHTFDSFEMNAASTVNDHSGTVNDHQEPQTQCVLKRRTTIRTAQRSLFRNPTVSRVDDEPVYGNVYQSRLLPTLPE